jgi:hypothetical protein
MSTPSARKKTPAQPQGGAGAGNRKPAQNVGGSGLPGEAGRRSCRLVLLRDFKNTAVIDLTIRDTNDQTRLLGARESLPASPRFHRAQLDPEQIGSNRVTDALNVLGQTQHA